MLWPQKKMSLIPFPTTSLALVHKDALALQLPPGIKMHVMHRDNSVSSKLCDHKCLNMQEHLDAVINISTSTMFMSTTTTAQTQTTGVEYSCAETG